MNRTAYKRNDDQRRFDLMVELRMIASDIEERFSAAESGDLSGRLERATDKLDDFIKRLLLEGGA